MSSLMDGDLDGDVLDQAMGAWRQEPQVRAAWHAYHLIGDVLRSDDLANPPAHDMAFVHALRSKLAQEPVPLAPRLAPHLAPHLAPQHEPHHAAQQAPQHPPGSAAQPRARFFSRSVSAPARNGSGWPRALVAPAAVAAGFFAVVGLLLANRGVTVNPADGGQMVARVDAGAATRVAAAQDAAASGALVRNANLDRYLQAHRSLANGVVAAGNAEHRVHIVYESK